MKESQAVASILDYAKQVDQASDELSKNILEINEQLEVVSHENQFLKLKLLEMEKSMMERTIAFGEITEIKDKHVDLLAQENESLKATLKMVMQRIRDGDFEDLKAKELVPETDQVVEEAD
jgi:CTP-dependent riboflavin kinase